MGSWSACVRVERLQLRGAGDVGVLAAQLRALVPQATSVRERVAEVIARVRQGGQEQLEACIRELDIGGPAPSDPGSAQPRGSAQPPGSTQPTGSALPGGGPPSPHALRVPPAAIEAALAGLDAEVRAGLTLAVANVTAVARAGLRDDVEVSLEQGQRVLLREIPVRRAGIYVPGGRAPYPSTVVMGAVTARVAGVDEVVVCSPPGFDGQVHPAILAACGLCGVDEVLAMGGAHAIAALAYGTEEVRRVDVIAGPGNLYVQEAKRQVSGDVGVDGFQGPSDLMIVLDAVDPPQLELVAADLLAQAEHGAESLVIAVSPAEEAIEEIARDLERLGVGAEGPPGTCALVCVDGLETGLALAESFAPEHLQLFGPDAEALAPRVRSAGCLLVGRASGTAFADYVAGSNHILPTAGAARYGSALSPSQFRRRMAQVEIGEAAPALAGPGSAIARAEGFELHARSMEARGGSEPRGGTEADGATEASAAREARASGVGENRPL